MAVGGIGFCRERMNWPTEKLNPRPLLDGNDLKKLGVRDGRLFGRILQAIRDEQLDDKIKTREQAIEQGGVPWLRRDQCLSGDFRVRRRGQHRRR